MCPCGLKAIYCAIVLSTLLYGAEAWTVYRRQVRKLHAFMPIMVRHLRSITWMDKVTNILERTGLPPMEDLQKESPVDWTPHEDVTRQATKADSLLSTVFWSQKERAPSSPVQGYYQEKPEPERHKDRLMDITHTAERYRDRQHDDDCI
ncbi:hypothetical protein NP493_393g03010 [Ridgeia piscesae]|uniref:Uncharacterized protein n=1 Tax=Ridgeia piscesae TaxID=27915 RepID=A0AAD9L345_RIDPI|nr:hypothetical protein NP493_393g03010 [Ridgeia piscesae]